MTPKVAALRAQSDDILRRFLRLDERGRRLVLRGLSKAQAAEYTTRWFGFENDGQRDPPGDWRIWLIRAGRGFGKTRAGSEWVSEVARSNGDARIALVAATQVDGQRVMIDGPSGLRAVARHGEEVCWMKGKRELRFSSGAVATLYSAEAGEELRGPEHHFAWCDELAKWRRGEAEWDKLMMGMRLGERPRVVVTTTPRVNAAMRRVLAAPGKAETLGKTGENPWLPEFFVSAMLETYGGTRLGELASLFWHCVKDRPETLTREAVGEAVVAQGVVAVTPALRVLLGQILQGR